MISQEKSFFDKIEIVQSITAQVIIEIEMQQSPQTIVPPVLYTYG